MCSPLSPSFPCLALAVLSLCRRFPVQRGLGRVPPPHQRLKSKSPGHSGASNASSGDDEGGKRGDAVASSDTSVASNSEIRTSTLLYTVEPPNNGHSEEWTTSLQWTNCSPPAYILSIHFYLRRRDQCAKCLSPMCPFFGGSTVLTVIMPYFSALSSSSSHLNSTTPSLTAIVRATNPHDGQTAAHRAALSGKQENLALLLHYDPECVLAKDLGGNTPLHLACRGTQKKAYRKTVEIILVSSFPFQYFHDSIPLLHTVVVLFPYFILP